LSELDSLTQEAIK